MDRAGPPAPERAKGGALLEALDRWARRQPLRLAGVNPAAVITGALRRAAAVRVTGRAAEMAYYAIVSLVPLLTAVGASLGFLERLLGAERVAEIEAALIGALGVAFAADVTAEVLAPIVREVLREERTAVAAGGALIALLLVARVFRSAGMALDAAYGVAQPRRGLASWLAAVLLALAATVVVTLTLTALVVGPLLGGGRALAGALDLGPAFEVAWGLWRWPVVFLVGVAFLLALYRLASSTDHRWRAALPGAVVAMGGAVLVALGLRAYFAAAGPRVPAPEEPAAAVALAGQLLGGVLAGALWAWLTNVAVLLGGVLNAELAEARAGRDRRVGRSRGR